MSSPVVRVRHDILDPGVGPRSVGEIRHDNAGYRGHKPAVLFRDDHVVVRVVYQALPELARLRRRGYLGFVEMEVKLHQLLVFVRAYFSYHTPPPFMHIYYILPHKRVYFKWLTAK